MNGFKAEGIYPEINSSLLFEPMHNIHLGISKILKECMVSIKSSESMLADVTKERVDQTSLFRIRNAVLLGCTVMLTAFNEKGKHRL